MLILILDPIRTGLGLSFRGVIELPAPGRCIRLALLSSATVSQDTLDLGDGIRSVLI